MLCTLQEYFVVERSKNAQTHSQSNIPASEESLTVAGDIGEEALN